MPTIIAVDVSLSMCRPCGNGQKQVPSSESEVLTRKKLAAGALSQFLGHLSANCKLEYASLVAFSHDCEVVSPFSRDFENLRSQFCLLQDRDRTNYETLLHTIEGIVVEQWGTAIPVQILIVTDGSPGFGPGCLKSVVESAQRFPFQAKMNVLALSDPDEKNYSENCQLLQQLIEATCGDGVVYFPDDFNSSKGCAGAISKICAKDFTPYRGMLRCGQLMSGITLAPPPQPFIDNEGMRSEISEIIDIVGFITNNDLAGPSAHSRHLILACRNSDEELPGLSQDADTSMETDATVPNFCVLLHGAMKVEGYSAIVEVGEDWFGYIVSWTDGKKKSNLMLSLWPPGTDVIPWLGNLAEIGSKDEFVSKLIEKYGPEGTTMAPPAFPIKPAEVKSYSANATIWSNAAGINADLQKLMRFAKKLPDKTSQFYKELNRMRRWALTIGFPEILDTMTEILHREFNAHNVNPEAAMQLQHAMNQLRSKMAYTKMLTPHKP